MNSSIESLKKYVGETLLSKELDDKNAIKRINKLGLSRILLDDINMLDKRYGNIVKACITYQKFYNNLVRTGVSI